MNIGARLLACAAYVSGKGTVIDVGTDHAKLPVYLVSEGIIKKAIAADVVEGPLNNAKKTIEAHHYENQITTLLSDGICEVKDESITDVIIAGMGGETMIEIMSVSHPLLKNREINFILQPMTKQEILRQWLSEHGYCILEEKILEEGTKLYNIMNVVYSPENADLSEVELLFGKMNYTEPASKKWIERKLGVMRARQSAGLPAFDIQKYKKEKQQVTVGTVYDLLNDYIPFDTQEKWDNSGLLVGGRNCSVKAVLLAMDITKDVVYEAEKLGCDLILSHHPVIFGSEGLHSIDSDSPVYLMIQKGISAICCHTPLDKIRLKMGVNDALYQKLRNCLDLPPMDSVFETEYRRAYGALVPLNRKYQPSEIAFALKKEFHLDSLRYCEGKKPITKIYYCSGSGGSMLPQAVAEGADTVITGDVKHDVWMTASNLGVALFDCGHYHTEQIVLKPLKELLEEYFDFPCEISKQDYNVLTI